MNDVALSTNVQSRLKILIFKIKHPVQAKRTKKIIKATKYNKAWCVLAYFKSNFLKASFVLKLSILFTLIN